MTELGQYQGTRQAASPEERRRRIGVCREMMEWAARRDLPENAGTDGAGRIGVRDGWIS